MKILLVTPPKEALTVTPPLGLGYIASVLRDNKNDVAILDAQKKSLNIESVVKKIKEINPDILGVSALTSNYCNAKRIIKKIKEERPGIKVVIGGPHASALPESTLKESAADYLVKGEGEYPFLKLVNFLKKERKDPYHIENLYYKENGKIKANPVTAEIENLDEIPFPAWDLIDPREYPLNPHQFFFKKHPIAPIITTRGCPYLCTFCSAGFLLGRKLRLRSPERVVDEIELLVNKFGVKEIHFEDDNFTLVKEHARAICKEIVKRKIKIVWQCPNGIRADALDDGLIRLMKESGCYRLAFGIESGSQEILDRANKKLNLVNVANVMKMVKERGIETQAFFIMGLPGETKETAIETIKFMKELPIDLADISLLNYLPGSRLFSEKYNAGECDNIDWDEFNYFTAQPTDSLSQEELKTFQKRAMRQFYLNPKTMFYLLKNINVGQVSHILKIMLKYIL